MTGLFDEADLPPEVLTEEMLLENNPLVAGNTSTLHVMFTKDEFAFLQKVFARALQDNKHVPLLAHDRQRDAILTLARSYDETRTQA
jgi:hypothetical protein